SGRTWLRPPLLILTSRRSATAGRRRVFSPIVHIPNADAEADEHQDNHEQRLGVEHGVQPPAEQQSAGRSSDQFARHSLTELADAIRLPLLGLFCLLLPQPVEPPIERFE